MYGLYSNEAPQILQAFEDQTGVTFPLLQSQGTLGKFAYPPGTGYPFPKDVVIGKGLVVRSIKGSFNSEELVPLIESLVAE